MGKTKQITVIAGLLLSGGALWVAVSESQNPHGHVTGTKTCAQCHAGDAPRVHTADFVKKQHMTQAYLNWQACTTCHWERSCNDCHEQKESAPDYHTPIFRDTVGKGRMEHVLRARMHPESCMVCHTHRYATTCGKCHSPSPERGP